MKVKIIAVNLLLLLVVTGCSSIIYAIRGPKYKGKFDISTYPPELDSTSYYYSVGEYYGDTTYNYVKYNNNGIYYGYASKGKALSVEDLDTMKPYENYFIYKRGHLRWEVYPKGFDGPLYYKAKIYKDSIVEWQIGVPPRETETYYRLE